MPTQLLIRSVLSESIAFVAALLGPLFGRDSLGSAARVRGKVWSKGLGATNLFVGKNVQFVGSEHVRIGKDVSFYGNTYLNAGGEHGSIEIGDTTHIDQFCVLYGLGGLKIGARCAIASGVIMYTQTNQYYSDPQTDIIDQPIVYAAVTIGDDVWIGASAVILPGVNIGSHAVIAAGAVVRQNVDEWTIVGGVPARVIGNRRGNSSA